jgi:hypothetical protein
MLEGRRKIERRGREETGMRFVRGQKKEGLKR